MKTIKNLYQSIFSFDNLLLAADKAQKGRKNSNNVANFNFNLEWELLRLHEELKSQTYQPGKYHTFYIFDPKKRMISAAPFRDRVVHHAICNIIHPIFERTFIFDSYANRKGKGTHAAINRCQYFLRKNKYVLKADIRKYFPSIDHEILKLIIRKKIGCAKTLWLVDLIIDNSNRQEDFFQYYPKDDLFTPFERKKGLPIGNLTSQYFANIYLNTLDHFIKETLQQKYYIRYVDDFVIFDQSKEKLKQVRKAIIQFLCRLRLTLHPNKCYITPTEKGITFLGQRIFTTHKLLKNENVRRMKKRNLQKIRLYQKGLLSGEQLEASFNSWIGHAKQADSFLLQKKVFQEILNHNIHLVKSRKDSWIVLGFKF